MREAWVPSLGWKDSPGGGHGNPLQYSCLENPQGQRSLAGYSPWGCKGSDTTGRLSTQHSRPCKGDSESCSETPGVREQVGVVGRVAPGSGGAK